LTTQSEYRTQSSSRPFKTVFRPGWGEVDQDWVLHFPVVFRYFKEAEAQLYQTLGVRRRDLLTQLDIWMPRVETHCTFHRPIRYDQHLEIMTTIGKMADKTITYDYRIAAQNSQDLLAEGYLTILIVSAKEFKPVQVPEPLRNLLTPYLREAAPDASSTGGKPSGPVGELAYGSGAEHGDEPSQPPSDHPFTTDIRVASTDIDPAGLVYFARYPLFLARAEDQFFCAMGYPRPALEKRLNAKLFRQSVHFRFEKGARYGDLLEVSLGIADLTPQALTYSFEFSNRADSSVATEGYVTIRTLSRPSLEPIDVADQLSDLRG
jgi:acyl-CoA thioester hydrolase